jgi:hypothetical protein
MMYLTKQGDKYELQEVKPIYTKKDLWAMAIILLTIIGAMIYFYNHQTV